MSFNPRFSHLLLGLVLSMVVGQMCWADAGPGPTTERVEVTLRFLIESVTQDDGRRSEVRVHLVPWEEGNEKIEAADSPLPIHEFSVSVPGDLQVEVPAFSHWTFSIESDQYWLAERQLEAQDRDEVYSLLLRPAGWLVADVKGPADDELPDALEVGVVQSRARDTAARSRSDCPLTEGSIRCKVPAGSTDVKLSAEGMIPHYFWDLEVAPQESLSLGEIRLVQGASLIGWILAEQTSEEPKPIQAELTPEVYGFDADPAAQSRVASMELRTSVEENGFFQLTGIPQGSYRLSVSSPSYSTFESGLLTINSSEEFELDPVELRPRATVRFLAEPVTDPFHEPWRFKLEQTESHSLSVGRYDGRTNPEGLWELPDVEMGSYWLAVYDSRGSKWHEERLEIWRPDLEHRVELPLTRLEIRLSLAEEPLENAQIKLENLKAGARLQRQTNEEGVAYFFLPTDLQWDAFVIEPESGVRAQFDELEVPGVEGDERWPILELEIPDTTLHGVVVNEDEERQPKAVVDLEMSNGDRLDAPVDREGEFRVRGFEPGAVTLQARQRHESGEHRRSGVIDVQAGEGQEIGPIRLMLETSHLLQGQVVAPSGSPVPGAFVVAFPELSSQPASNLLEQIYTDANGAFEVSVRGSVSAVQLAIFPPGFAATQQRVLLPSEAIIVPVDTAAGTIVLEWDQSPEAADDGELIRRLRAETILLKDSLVGAGYFLSLWNQRNEAVSEPGTLKLPMMEPGRYTACHGSRVAQSALAGRPVPWAARNSCVGGFLPEGGDLVLTIPNGPR